MNRALPKGAFVADRIHSPNLKGASRLNTITLDHRLSAVTGSAKACTDLRRFLLALTMLAGIATWTPVHALTVTDILGREVELDGSADRVILGEGRFLAVLGVLGVKDPLSRVAGMLDEFRQFDPAGYAAYREALPAIDSVPLFGHISEASVSVEKAIALGPDVAIFGIEGHGPSSRSKHIVDALSAAGIPAVFIDFRKDPMGNTVRSVEIVGKVLGLEAEAHEFAKFFEVEHNRVIDRLATSPPATCPTVLIELHVGARETCCTTVSEGLFAEMVDALGGCNIARDLLPGAVGEVSLEHVLDVSPDVYIGTAVGTVNDPPGSRTIVLGAHVDGETARDSLDRALSRTGIRDLDAVRADRAHGLWHHFYNSPLNIAAFQQIAKWLHPDLFADLDPDNTLDRLLERFAPIDLEGTYFVTRGE